MPRFVLLEHVGAPDDPAGRHFDLLLEEGQACRSWRLAAIPVAGHPVAAVGLQPHRLAWLDHVAGPVSGGRGHARRVDAGSYEVVESDEPSGRLCVVLGGSLLGGRLTIAGGEAALETMV